MWIILIIIIIIIINVTLSPRHRAAANRCNVYQKLCIHSEKCSWRWASLSPETCRAVLKSSIKRSIKGICCILLVANIAVLTMHGLINIKSKEKLSSGNGRTDDHTNKNRQTDRQADVTQPIVAFRYFANARKKKEKQIQHKNQRSLEWLVCWMERVLQARSKTRQKKELTK